MTKADPIAQFLTNMDRNVFCTIGLPEEVVAKLFAVYSRSPTTLRDNLRDMLGEALFERDKLAEKFLLDQAATTRMFMNANRGARREEIGEENARVFVEENLRELLDFDVFAEAEKNAGQFHDKWVVGYGHASVAEHAVVHIGVERCSIMGAKNLEDGRLASFTEKSTRYVDFSNVPLPDPADLGVPPAAAERFTNAMRRLVGNYAAMVVSVIDHLRNTAVRAEGVADRAFDTQIRTRAYDLCRGLLPIGMPTSVGMTFNSRHLAHTIKKLSSSVYYEDRTLAAAIREEASKVCPTLLKYTEDDGARVGSRDNAKQLLHSLRKDAAQSVRASVSRPVHVESSNPTGTELVELFRAVCRDLGMDHTCFLVESTEAENVIEAYLRRPEGKPEKRMFQQPGRALEVLGYTADVIVNYGAWRDLQRHRQLTHLGTIDLWEDLGYCIPDEIAAIPHLKTQYSAAIDEASDIWTSSDLMLCRAFPWHDYLHILAKNIRWQAYGSLREWFYVCERRSQRQGHIDYRRVVIEIADQIKETLPILKRPGVWDIDRVSYEFARSGN